jgi:hypothetical protein
MQKLFLEDENTFCSSLRGSHHAEGRVDPVTNFFQKLIQIHKMWLKLAKKG